LNAWYGGQSGGTAVADVLAGDYNPSGKLPITFYKNLEQLDNALSKQASTKDLKIMICRENLPLYDGKTSLSFRAWLELFKICLWRFKTEQKYDQYQ
jgi:hypothetical protein